jgi:hypothetical protein
MRFGHCRVLGPLSEWEVEAVYQKLPMNMRLLYLECPPETCKSSVVDEPFQLQHPDDFM